MRVIIDTHVFLWWVEGDKALPAKARAALANAENECLLSLASAWELSIKSALGKLKLATPVQRYVTEHVAANGFRLLDIQLGHIGRVETLPTHHSDPFDRLLIAQGLEENLPIVTADVVFARYGVTRIW
jgi:PIN domain nuclease of toxin-antitoxin system